MPAWNGGAPVIEVVPMECMQHQNLLKSARSCSTCPHALHWHFHRHQRRPKILHMLLQPAPLLLFAWIRCPSVAAIICQPQGLAHSGRIDRRHDDTSRRQAGLRKLDFALKAARRFFAKRNRRRQGVSPPISHEKTFRPFPVTQTKSILKTPPPDGLFIGGKPGCCQAGTSIDQLGCSPASTP